MTKTIHVGISDMAVSNDRDAILVTHALGSCIAVMVYDPVTGTGGMLHYMLPSSKTSPQKAKSNPAMFADTGVPELFRMMYAMRCVKENLVIKVVGGSNINDKDGTFEIGKRNYVMLRKLFWKNKLLIEAEDVGGDQSRTTRLFLDSGKAEVFSNGQTWEI